MTEQDQFYLKIHEILGGWKGEPLIQTAERIIRERDDWEQTNSDNAARANAAEEKLKAPLHASAPKDMMCADCTMDREPCPTCYTAWWKARHPNVHFLQAEPAP